MHVTKLRRDHGWMRSKPALSCSYGRQGGFLIDPVCVYVKVAGTVLGIDLALHLGLAQQIRAKDTGGELKNKPNIRRAELAQSQPGTLTALGHVSQSLAQLASFLLPNLRVRRTSKDPQQTMHCEVHSAF